MRLTLRQVEVFVTLARLRHFGRAASLLGITQPTLSGDVRALEKALEVRLFDRSPRGTELTTAGAALVPHAREVLAAAAKFESEAREFGASARATVRVAATPSMVNRLIPRLLERFMGDLAAPSLDVVEVNTGDAVRALAAGDADLAVGHFLDRPPGGGSARIGSDAMWVVARSGEIEASAPVAPRELRAADLLMFPRAASPEYFDTVLSGVRDGGFRGELIVSPVRISGSYSFLLTTGQAFAVVPEDYARETPHNLAAAPLSPPLRIPVDVAWMGVRDGRIEEVIRMLEAIHRRVRDDPAEQS